MAGKYLKLIITKPKVNNKKNIQDRISSERERGDGGSWRKHYDENEREGLVTVDVLWTSVHHYLTIDPFPSTFEPWHSHRCMCACCKGEWE